MSGNIRLYNTNGYVELQAPTSASAQTLVLPTDSIQPGLVHLHTETFSAVSSVSIDNVFSSTYDNYKIVAQYAVSSASDAQLLLRSSGSNISTNYIVSRFVFLGTTTSNNGSVSSSLIYSGAHGPTVFFEVDVHNPFLAKRTSAYAVGVGQNTPNVQSAHLTAGEHNVETSCDGFTFSSSTMTGTLRVYGYRNA